MPTHKIVVLNDDPLFLHVVQRLLLQAGYQVVIGRIGGDGQDLIRQERPVLVLLDMQHHQPEDGWMQIRLLRRDPLTAALPVLIYSSDAHFLRRQAQQLRQAHVEVLELPFTPDELLQKVGSMLGLGIQERTT